MEKLLGSMILLLLVANLILCESNPCLRECECEDKEMKGKKKKVIDCSNRGLLMVPSFMEVAGQSFDYLLLNRNKISNLQSRAFRGLNVKHLDISENQIRGVSDNAFKSLSGLQELTAENAGLFSAPLALAQLDHLHILR